MDHENQLFRSAPCSPLTLPGILGALGAHPWADLIQVLDCTDSTNTLAKRLALQGAPAGTVLLANRQTGGRGRMGRQFSSQPGAGIYMSVLLRPGVPPSDLLHLTAAAAVAAADAIAQETGLRPGIKWVNDLIADGRKLGGILTELTVDTQSGLASSAVLGIGINCTQQTGDFPPALQKTAVSIVQATGVLPDRSRLAAALIRHFSEMERTLLSEPSRWLDRYRADCITLGRQVRVIRSGGTREALAIGLDAQAGLLVEYPDGTREAVSSGEVSIRGRDGYL